jgi:hypothetical protein
VAAATAAAIDDVGKKFSADKQGKSWRRHVQRVFNRFHRPWHSRHTRIPRIWTLILDPERGISKAHANTSYEFACCLFCGVWTRNMDASDELTLSGLLKFILLLLELCASRRAFQAA